MTRFNFKEACLLDASGELSLPARQELAAYLASNPAARQEYESIREQFDTLQSLPLIKISREQQLELPAHLKEKLHAAALAQARARRAATHRKLIQCALAGLTSAAAAVMLVASMGGFGGTNWNARDREQSARINAALERYAPASDSLASSYDLAVNDVDARIRQLQTDSPTLAQLHDRSMGNLLDALSTMSQDMDDRTPADSATQVSYPAAAGATRAPGKTN
jgi:anti-sigma factor RsiW